MSAQIDRYFELSQAIERAQRERNFPVAIQAARETYALLPSLVRAWKQEYGAFDIVTSLAVHTAPTLMALLEDREAIRSLRLVLESVEELKPWLPVATEAEEDLALVPRIIASVREDPGMLQSSLKSRLGLANGTRAGRLTAGLEKAGRIRRVAKGSTQRLYPAGHVIPTAALPGQTDPSFSEHSYGGESFLPAALLSSPCAWVGRAAQDARLLDFSGLPIVRLPMAPRTWEERDLRTYRTGSSRDSKKHGRLQHEFVVEGPGWSLAREEKLPLAERPHSAFKEVFHASRYTHWVDPKGKREGYEYSPSVLRVTGPEGRVTAERGLKHDVYRSDVNADGTGILFLARQGVLHGYTESLAVFLEARLQDLPEYQAQASRLGIEPGELKNHTRCVAISADRSRYLVTVVDEAWCLETTTGEIVWGFRMPTQEGWTRRVATRSASAGTSAEVEAALKLMELQLPLTPEDITRQFRLLAKRWHPDLHPEDQYATARFQSLGAAMELLTGTNLSRLAGCDVDRVTYDRILSTVDIAVPDGQGGVVKATVSLGWSASEKTAADWIYAANLGKDGSAFLAGYSGKVVVVSPLGVPELVYDIGAVPRQIMDAGQHLYLLTDTRLYVLSGSQLEALVDVYDAGNLVITDAGFALVESKALTWFQPNGAPVGRVHTKAPIRRVFSTSQGLVVETRQHRALVSGTPAWWT